ncbi:hypothetical protein VNO78_12402 [Psophocarpus tetragonolobus]|uniref:Uncharacterized protein n=1 Tax=Psophocarpus tetragonolobus TaxID=3891 RepID=A0AAN9SP21_PSOTE
MEVKKEEEKIELKDKVGEDEGEADIVEPDGGLEAVHVNENVDKGGKEDGQELEGLEKSNRRKDAKMQWLKRWKNESVQRCGIVRSMWTI